MNKTVIGFTGSSRPISCNQESMIYELLKNYRELYGATDFHHGDCVNADALAHDIAFRLGYFIIIHPPDNPRFRAFRGTRNPSPMVIVKPERPYLVRNQDIVDESHVLIAAPGTEHERLRSGTWSTIRRGRDKARLGEYPIHIITPSGKLL